ncbi:MAG: hypothetical protein LC745_00110 [Planctomycetia bacterium]|nr:hypothetical protein [Planctomycetia bacterium]
MSQNNLPAGIGDVAIGVTAPFVAWPLLGVLDLVFAVGAGAAACTFLVLTGDPTGAGRMVVMNQLSLSLVPTFTVPLFVILHLATLLQVGARPRAALADQQPRGHEERGPATQATWHPT